MPELKPEQLEKLNATASKSARKSKPQNPNFTAVVEPIDVNAGAGAAQNLATTTDRMMGEVLTEAKQVADAIVAPRKTELAKRIGENLAQAQLNSLDEVEAFLLGMVSSQSVLRHVLPQQTIEVQALPAGEPLPSV